MKKGISGFFGFDYDWKQRFRDIKEAGFDVVITSVEPRFEEQNGEISEQMKFCKEIGLGIDSLHCTYTSKELPYFWENGEKGDEILRLLKKELKISKDYSFRAFVVHIMGEPSEIGMKRMREFVSYAEEIDAIIALENVQNSNKLLDYVFSHIESPNLKFCYDAGHENFIKGERGVLKKFLDKLICFHLHDNDGNSDQHTLNKYGTINWKKLAKKFAQKENIEEICLSYELIPRFKKDETPQQMLNECFAQAVELEKMILKYKKKW